LLQNRLATSETDVNLGEQFFHLSFALLASLTGSVISMGSWNILLAGYKLTIGYASTTTSAPETNLRTLCGTGSN
jgi:hypothetical protein